jgi:hypothetical protein
VISRAERKIFRQRLWREERQRQKEQLREFAEQELQSFRKQRVLDFLPFQIAAPTRRPTQCRSPVLFFKWPCYVFLVRLYGHDYVKVGSAPDAVVRCERLLYDINHAAKTRSDALRTLLERDPQQRRECNRRLLVPTSVQHGKIIALYNGGRSIESRMHHRFKAYRAGRLGFISGSTEFYRAAPMLAALEIVP